MFNCCSNWDFMFVCFVVIEYLYNCYLIWVMKLTCGDWYGWTIIWLFSNRYDNDLNHFAQNLNKISIGDIEALLLKLNKLLYLNFVEICYIVIFFTCVTPLIGSLWMYDVVCFGFVHFVCPMFCVRLVWG